MTAAVIAERCQSMVYQMALPLVSERRVKGALQIVARDCDLSYSKVRKLFYRITDHVLAFERDNIVAAFKAYTIKQERAYREQADKLAAINAEIVRLEGQYGMDLPIDPRVVGTLHGQGSPNAR